MPKKTKSTRYVERIEVDILADSVERRPRSQILLLKHLELLRNYRPCIGADEKRTTMINQLAGAAFSLWRATFLTHAERETPRILDDLDQFLQYVICNNAIGYPQEYGTKAWYVGFCLNNVRFRLNRICECMPEVKSLAAMQPIVHMKPSSHGIRAVERWDAFYPALHAITDLFEAHCKESSHSVTAPALRSSPRRRKVP